MRLFLGVPISESLRERLIDLQSQLDSLGVDFKFVSSNQLHFTVKFLGSVSPVDLDSIKSIVFNLSNQFSSFEVSVGSLGVFPSFDFVRVVWVGVFKNEELFVKLISLVDEKLSFIRRSDHSLQPHLTLARVKSPRNKEALVKFVNDNCNICLGNLLVDKLVLYSSQLTSLGPVYNVLSKFSLSS